MISCPRTLSFMINLRCHYHVQYRYFVLRSKYAALSKYYR